MAGDWLKMEANTPDKPEVFEIATQLGITTAEAFGRLFLVWRLFDQQTEDGNAVNVTHAYLDHVAGVSGFSKAMQNVGWLDGGNEGAFGVRLPNFDRHNGQTAKKRVLTAKRVATHKQRLSNAGLTHGALPREEKRREEEKQKEEVVLLPDWLPKDAWKEWLKVRKSLKAPNTPRALNLAVAELDRLRGLGHDPKDLIEQSTLKGWKSFYPGKIEAVKEPVSKLCDYCGKAASGSVNGYWHCSAHQLSAMDCIRPLGAMKVAA